MKLIVDSQLVFNRIRIFELAEGFIMTYTNNATGAVQTFTKKTYEACTAQIKADVYGINED